MSSSTTNLSGADETRGDILVDSLEVLTNKHLRDFKRYPAYRGSGIDWMGEIPSHWKVSKASWLFSIGSGTTPNSDDPIHYGGDIPWITTSELRESVINETEKTLTRHALKVYTSLRIHPKGSVAVAMYGATIGRIGVLGVPATVNQACCVFSSAQHIETQFWFYWLQMRRPYLISLGYGGGQPNLSQDLLRSIRVPVPHPREQREVATFLDRETAKLDALIAKKERIIELLQERRTALIMRAVTGGLDPSVPTKNSGVEWLGDTPAHWDIAKIWRISTARSGATPSKDEPKYWDGSIPWVSPKDMKRRLIDSSEDTLTEQAIAETGITLFGPPVVLIVVRGMILAHSFPVALAVVPVTINQDMKALTFCKHIQPLFVVRFFEGIGKHLLVAIVEEAAHGTRAIRMDQWRQVAIPVPPEPEQILIIRFLDKETARIDGLVAKVRTAVMRLKEYRISLISAAVTGKIDVREEVV
jgi:type I restriction enzyme, S subunit